MAVVLGFRLAIALTPVLYRAAVSGQPSLLQQGGFIAQDLWRRLHDENESDSDLSEALSDATGYDWQVATYTGSFELRKLQVAWTFTPAGTPAEDKRICTFHFAKLASGTPTENWLAADFTAAEGAFDTFWNAIKGQYLATTVLAQYRWYKAGPGISPPQEPVRVVDKSVAGTSATGTPVQLPPQVALSVTEQTSSRKAWGRFYLPAPHHYTAGSASGRWVTSNITDVANAADTMYEAVKAAGIPIVVYSAAKPERPKKPSGTLPATAARALTVDQIQIDDIPDVIRSRRHSTVALKLQRAIA